MLNFFNKKLHNDEGFTLVELMVVIAVLGIVAAIAIPRMTGVTDAFEVNADQETATLAARNVEVLLMAGAIAEPTGTNVTTVNADAYGEALPTAQSNSDAAMVITIAVADDDAAGDFVITVTNGLTGDNAATFATVFTDGLID